MRPLELYTLRILPVIVILPFVLIALYNHPALDDWWYAEVYKQHGLLGAQQYWYTNYTARFFSNFLMTLAPLSFRWIEGYKVMPFVFLLSLFLTLLFVVKTLFRSYTSHHCTLTLWLVVAYLFIQRDYFEAIYWLAGNVVYQFNMLFFLLQLTLLYRIVMRKQHNKLYIPSTIALSIAITGSNETLGELVLVESVVLLYTCYKQHRLRGFAVLFLLTQLACWTFMFLAPGNWAKVQDSSINEHRFTFFFAEAIKHSVVAVGYYSVYLLKFPSVWCLLLLSVPLVRFVLLNMLQFTRKGSFILLGILCFCTALAVYFISMYPTGIWIPPLRVTNIAMVFLFSGMALSVTWLTEAVSFVQRLTSLVQSRKAYVMTACVLFAAVTPTKYRQLLTDLSSGKAKAYNNAMYARYETIKAANSDTCFVQRFLAVPRTIIATDVGGKVSRNMGYVFDKQTVVIIK